MTQTPRTLAPKTLAKICGLSTAETVQAAIVGGAAYVGFVFYAKSPRNLTPEAAAPLAELARKAGVKVVAVTVNPDDALLDHLMSVLNPDHIQLHGAESSARVLEVQRRTGRGVIKALPVFETQDLAAAAFYDDIVEHLMFDAKTPAGSALPGGVGAQFDWILLKNHNFQRPYFLAGGLNAANVAQAIRLSGAPLVDVSSGVERAPGLKDAALITAFLDAVLRA